MSQFPEQVLLEDLLMPWLKVNTPPIQVSGITLDSRSVSNGDLFVAIQGALMDGRTYINNAIKSGACAVLSETKNEQKHGQVEILSGVTIIQIYQLPMILSELAYRFYFSNIELHKVVAITGTNGKTTIASLLANCCDLLGKKSAQMGTIGNGLFGQLKSSLNTTLDPISVFSELREYQQQSVQYTFMEVSSHGLYQDRVTALPFHSAIFTNLTRDHLDYHESMENYEQAKKSLFSDYPLKHRIINADDPTGSRWLKDFPDAIAYGFNAEVTDIDKPYLHVSDVNYHAQGVNFNFQSSWGDGEISAPFYGDFNVSNLAAVLTQLLVEDVTIKQAEHIFPKLTMVPGRMEQYHFEPQAITFVVDYAHTPDALKNALLALQKHKSEGRLICVFGCGGDRDKGKRPEMAKVAESYAQKVVLVDDNPRTENSDQIMNDIMQGFINKDAVEIIHQRQRAVKHLLATAQVGDIVLLAGKGHEDYQIIGNQRIHYSDRELLASLQD
ncbi:MAG: UDP-N-acetylmuramoyl-L-alanyl-D-glutamate--2,6-diaminopimelate ligase [Psychromonas sp.]